MEILPANPDLESVGKFPDSIIQVEEESAILMDEKMLVGRDFNICMMYPGFEEILFIKIISKAKE